MPSTLRRLWLFSVVMASACEAAAPLDAGDAALDGHDGRFDAPEADGALDASEQDGATDVPSDGGEPPRSCDDFPAQGEAEYLSIVPARRGFGLDTAAGSGREGGEARLFRVTHLGDGGPGSLRACIEESGPRTCVFEVSGTIEGEGALEIREPYITIAGQTAPSPGITLRNTTLFVLNTHDVLIQHLRVRVGDAADGFDPANRDAIAIGSFGATDTHHVVLDHVSVSWATDENVSVWADDGTTTSDVAIIDSIVAEGLRCSIHPEGCHSTGLLVGRGTERTLVLGSLFAHNDWRNPLVRDAFDDFVIASSLVHADGDEGIVLGDNVGRDGPSHADVLASVVRLLPVRVGSPDGPYTEGSAFHVDVVCDGAECIDDRGSEPTALESAPTVAVPGLVVPPVEEVTALVLRSAGARPADRDAVDERVVDDVTRGMRRLIDSPTDVGGWPELEENEAPYVDPADPTGIPAADPATGAPNPGYTARELHLHALARAVTCR